MRPDVLIITADHGNDPTTIGSDHSRERVPVLIFGQSIKQNSNLGTHLCFADIAATIADFLGIRWLGAASSSTEEIYR